MAQYPASFRPRDRELGKASVSCMSGLYDRGARFHTTANFEVRTLAFQMPDRGGGPTGPRIRVGRPSRRVRTLLMTLGVLAVLAMAFVMFAGFWTDWLWYRSVALLAPSSPPPCGPRSGCSSSSGC